MTFRHTQRAFTLIEVALYGACLTLALPLVLRCVRALGAFAHRARVALPARIAHEGAWQRLVSDVERLPPSRPTQMGSLPFTLNCQACTIQGERFEQRIIYRLKKGRLYRAQGGRRAVCLARGVQSIQLSCDNEGMRAKYKAEGFSRESIIMLLNGVIP